MLTTSSCAGAATDTTSTRYGENLGRDDQYLDLKGGRYDTFKYRLYSDQLRHNFGSGPGARSPFSGIGGATLTAPFPLPAVPALELLRPFVQAPRHGGMFELSDHLAVVLPRRGERSASATASTSMPARTAPARATASPTCLRRSTGRRATTRPKSATQARRGHFAVNLSYSTFENDNQVLRWSNGFFRATALDTTMLPPDNELTRLGVNGNLRQLPLDSTLAGRFTYSKLTNDTVMPPTMFGPNNAVVPAPPPTGAHSRRPAQAARFNGEIVYKTALGCRSVRARCTPSTPGSTTTGSRRTTTRPHGITPSGRRRGSSASGGSLRRRSLERLGRLREQRRHRTQRPARPSSSSTRSTSSAPRRASA